MPPLMEHQRRHRDACRVPFQMPIKIVWEAELGKLNHAILTATREDLAPPRPPELCGRAELNKDIGHHGLPVRRFLPFHPVPRGVFPGLNSGAHELAHGGTGLRIQPHGPQRLGHPRGVIQAHSRAAGGWRCSGVRCSGVFDPTARDRITALGNAWRCGPLACGRRCGLGEGRGRMQQEAECAEPEYADGPVRWANGGRRTPRHSA